jgi:signal transduction histidine kinase
MRVIFGPVNKLLNILIIMFLAMLPGLTLVVYFFSKTVTRPLVRLSFTAAEIGKGKLDTVVEVKSKDEFGSLAATFNQMAANLKKTTTSIDNLNKEIAGRKKIEEDLSRALKKEVRDREVMASMLDDNNQTRERLEQHIEDLKRTQDMLIQSDKLASLGKLVADMAHEVNNPLMIISGNAQLSLLDESLNQELKNNLKIIHEECNRAKSIIQRLLMFSRPSKGEQRSLDINQSIESVVKLLEHQFSLSNVKINRRFNTGLPFITADERQFQEVIMNLLNNARDAMPGGGEITINTSLDGEYLKINIKDSGVGMDDKTLTRAFEPFFTTKEKGTGLGLSVCYGIIKAHKGKIEVKSQPQKGTTVHIWLPLKAEGV